MTNATQYSTVKVKYKDVYVYVSYDNEQSAINKENLTYSINNFNTEDYFFDYDNICLENPINASDVLDKWNFLMDIASAFGMYFEGNVQKHTKTYNYLFSCSTAINKMKMYKLPQNYIISVKKVFAKSDRLLNRLFEYAKNTDWRLSTIKNEEEILQNKKLSFQKFKTIGVNDHEHCYFCWQKITDLDIPDIDIEGYCFYNDIYNRKIWICKNCYNDFKKRFNWEIKK